MTGPLKPHAANESWSEAAAVESPSYSGFDHKTFGDDIQALHAKLKADLGNPDLDHLRKMERWSRISTFLGYACAWMFPNPLAAFLIGMGNVGRWATVTHHVMHRGYDAVPNVPERYKSRRFAMGWRRFVDWLDWLHPAAWAHEHNHLHHYNTGQQDDPDLVERNAWFIRDKRMPRVLKWLSILLVMMTWKLTYYAPNTFWALKQHQKIKAQSPEQAKKDPLPTMGNVSRYIIPGERVVFPVTRWGVEFYLRCVLPYGLIRFGVIPALFLPLGYWAWSAVLINSILAEVVANVVSFVIIAPNHTGDDVCRFDESFKNKAEFYLQQITGSVNYPGGTDAKDFMMGYLNYQIEHHVWPDLPMLKYRQAAPQLKLICQKHGVPYIEESVFRRFGKLWSIMMGDIDMRNLSVSRPEFLKPVSTECDPA